MMPKGNGVDTRTRAPGQPAPAVQAETLAASCLHLVVLSCLAVAQPMLDLMVRYTEFFVVRGFDRAGVLVFVAALLILPPLPFVLVELSLFRCRPAVRKGVHLLFVGFFVCLIWLLILKRIEAVPAILILPLGVVLAAASAAMYSRMPAARTFVSLLSIGLVVIPASFVFNPSVAKLLGGPKTGSLDLPPVQCEAPIVFIVFDEFSLPVLLDGEFGINRYRYPNFAALADRSTWYRNAITAADFTIKAVPAALTGLAPARGKLPKFEDYPENLFTLFGGRYDLWVREPLTRLCPPELNRNISLETPMIERLRALQSDLWIVYLHLVTPDPLAERLPPITQAWSNFKGEPARDTVLADHASPPGKKKGNEFAGVAAPLTREDRRAEFEAMFAAFKNSPTPQLYFMHIMLPHCPWDLLPTGQRYRAEPAGILGVSKRAWEDNEFLASQGYQRYILQTMYVDRAIGQMIGRLEELDLFDRSLIVLVADHGTSFIPGELRRNVSYENAHEILPVPLIIKAPYQEVGEVVDQMVSTIDILPTMLDVLGEEIPWRFDGVSQVGVTTSADRIIEHSVRGGGVHRVTDEHLRRKYERVADTLRLFGSGEDPLDLYRLGPYPGMVGKPVSDLDRGGPLPWTVHIRAIEDFDNADPEGSTLPAFVQGSIRPDDSEDRAYDLAVAVNGVIFATVPTHTESGEWRAFSAMIPPFAYTSGANRIRVYMISENDGDLLIRPLEEPGPA